MDRSAALHHLADVVARADLALAADRDRLVALRDRLRQDIAGQAVRARDIEAPLLVVVGGVTGAGKSTIVNTLVGRRIVETGVIRPTTTNPTLVCAPDDVDWFTTPRVLSSLARELVTDDRPAGAPSPRHTAPATAGPVLRLVADAAQPVGTALLDAPDIDSVSVRNRHLADLLLDAADLWVWCTTAGKYADEESMRYLARAARRATPLLVALTQVREADRDAVMTDFARKLAGAGVRADALVAVGWHDVVDSMLPDGALADLSVGIGRLGDPDVRRRLRERTLDGAVAALGEELEPLVAAVADEGRTADELVRAVDGAYDQAVADFARSVDDGLPLRGEILGRWTDYVGSSAVLEATGRAAGTARAWVRGLLSGGGSTAERRIEREVRGEVAGTVTDTVVRLADLAAAQVERAWCDDAAGRRLVAATDLHDHDEGLPARATAAVEGWQDGVVRLVAEQGVERRTRARWMSSAVNAIATGAIVIALASTGGLTGVEAGIAAAAAGANQALLVTVLGERTVRWLIDTARRDLVRRVGDVLVPERRRRTELVERAAPPPELVVQLREAVARARR